MIVPLTVVTFRAMIESDLSVNALVVNTQPASLLCRPKGLDLEFAGSIKYHLGLLLYLY